MVATTELQPWAILANGPPCTSAGVCSKVWTKFGFKASFKRAAIAPSAFKSWAVIGLSSLVYPTIIRPRRSFKSLIELAKHKTAIISEATVMS